MPVDTHPDSTLTFAILEMGLCELNNNGQFGFPLGDFFSRERAKSECDWLVMSSVFVSSQSSCLAMAKGECDWLVMPLVFVASQSSCFFLRSREQIRLVENRLYSKLITNIIFDLGKSRRKVVKFKNLVAKCCKIWRI